MTISENTKCTLCFLISLLSLIRCHYWTRKEETNFILLLLCFCIWPSEFVGILLAISFLAELVLTTNTGDLNKLLRVLGYLKFTRDWVFKFEHRDRNPHNGLGDPNFPIVDCSRRIPCHTSPLDKSKHKQTVLMGTLFLCLLCVVKSSCEAELVCVSASDIYIICFIYTYYIHSIIYNSGVSSAN